MGVDAPELVDLAAEANGTSENELKSSRRGWYFPVGGGARAADVPELIPSSTSNDSEPELKSTRRGWYFPVGGGARAADAPELIELTAEANGSTEIELKSSRRGWYFPVGGGAAADAPKSIAS